MKAHISTSHREILSLNKTIYFLKNNISTHFSHEEATRIKHFVHDLNILIYNICKSTKTSKLSSLLPSYNSPNPSNVGQTEEVQDNLVHCIPEDLPLSKDERSVLSKGLNFIPLTQKADTTEMRLLLSRFYRTIRWTATLGSLPQRQSQDDPFLDLFSTKSGTMPPIGKSKAVEKYISRTEDAIASLKPKPLSFSNITPNEAAALASLKRRHDIVIKPADKGGVVVVWSRDLYESEASRQLQSDQHYKKLDGPSLDRDQKLIAKVVNQEIKSGSLPSSAKLLKIQIARQACFYMLPKIHKLNSPGRPIVSACSCPTEHISMYLDTLFQPLVQNLPSYIKDSTDALNKINLLKSNSAFRPTYLLTMDVTALYTNIPHGDGLNALKHFLNLRESQSPPTGTLLRLAELVLTLNTFEFNGEFFRQESGVAMGTKMGPSYACLFMGYLEKQIFSTFPGPIPEFYGRFIDDCLALSSLSKDELLEFVNFCNAYHPFIKFTFVISDSEATFMDILIQLISGYLSTSVFYKPTDSHSYLDYNSSHSLNTRNSIPYSQFLRLRRLCSENSDFVNKGKEMESFFIKRNYPMQVVRQGFNRACNVTRDAALRPSVESPHERPIVVIPYHPHHFPVKKILLDSWHILQQDLGVGRLFTSPPLVAYKRMANIKDSLVHSKLRGTTPESPKLPGTHNCGKPNCKACPYLDDNPVVRAPGSTFAIRKSFDCQMTNLVYIITCRECGQLYVGETGRSLETRFSEHLDGVRLKRDHLPVAKHFLRQGHSMQSMKVQVLWKVQGDILNRKHLESWLISKLKTMTPFGLNLKS